MTNKSYGRAILGKVFEEPNDAGGVSLRFSSAFDSPEVDFSNDLNVKVMATQALKTADGLASLVHKNRDSKRPVSDNDNFELLISLCALACEIYMKAIVYYHNAHGGDKIRKHKLNELMTMLPDEEKNRIRAKIPNINERLPAISDAFVELRYVFELNAFNKEYLLVFDLMDELYDICLKIERYKMPILKYESGIIRIE